MKTLIKKIIRKIKSLASYYPNRLLYIENQIEENRILCAKLHIEKINSMKEYPARLFDTEFKVFSQYGEDGIIQFLISKLPIKNEIFIEFGVEDYREANTRFLLVNNNWSGLIMDGSKKNMRQVRESEIYWRYDLEAKSAFITKDNINQLIMDSGISGDIGLLSIDIDGNDYWVWDSIDVVSPRIIICEYNSIFGCKEAITIPYQESFNRTKAHYSNLYFGASLKALCVLAERKGYIFAGSNRAGSNAFFVRKDVSSNIVPISVEDGYVKSKSRESRDEDGQLTYISGDNRIKLIENKEVIDVVNNKKKYIRDILL